MLDKILFPDTIYSVRLILIAQYLVLKIKGDV